MLAVTNFDLGLHGDIIENFFALASTGNVPPGNEPGHLDGWGIGYYRNGRARVVKSGGSVINERKRFLGALKRIKRSRVLIVHFRKSAWKDTSLKEHAHPFFFKNNIFAHNGTVYDYKKLLKLIPERFLPWHEALDTEVFFRYLACNFPKHLKTAIESAAKRCRYSSLNFLLSDGKRLYACRRYSKWPGYYTLFAAKSAGSMIVSSEPVSSKLHWMNMRQGELISFGL